MGTFLRNLRWMFFGKKPHEVLKENPTVYKIGGGWGDSIQWSEDKARWRVHGWKYRIPEVGDELRAAMTSGKTCRFVFLRIDRCWDPPDMFFADVYPVAYTDGSALQWKGTA